MDRRAYLATLAAGLPPLAAGCLGAPSAASVTATPVRTATPGPRLAGVDLPVPESELVLAINAAIPAVVEPAFADDWSGVEIGVGGRTVRPRLRPATPVIGVERHSVARAYPLGVMERHEVVNDTFPTGSGREPLLVTYCPACGSSMTAVRRVRGVAAVFEVSHRLWRSNLVLRDHATGSLWSQLLAGAIRGPATGEQLPLVPSTLTRWADWRAAHPETVVLLPPPLSETLYGLGGGRYDYDRYADSAPVIGEEAGELDGLRTLVIGITDGEASTAYPFEAVRAAGVVNDTVGDTPVVVTTVPGDSLVAYVRRIEGERLRFRRRDERTLVGGGSRWLVERGMAVEGPFEGVQLRRANDLPPLFRFAWEDFHPDTRIYGESG